jgi:type I restriction enzyme M protein
MNNAVKKYLDRQKIKAVEEYDFEAKKIKYSAKITTGRQIEKINGEEEIARAYLLAKLANELGYKLENIEIEKEYDLGRPKASKPRIDVIARDEKGNAFLYIELKSPQDYEKDKDEVIEKQLFNLASQEIGQGKKVKYLVLYTIEQKNNDIKDKCLLIDRERFSSFDEWKDIRNYADELPEHYGKAKKEPFVKGSKKDLDKSFSHEQLDSIRKKLHNVLWGGGGTDYNDIFSSLVNIILAKIQDEHETKNGEKYSFQGNNFESNEQIFEKINILYRRALKDKLQITDKNALQESFVIDRQKFSISKLKYVVSELEKYSFTEGNKASKDKDILGEFFENIVSTGFKQSKGQFFTHLNIVKFLLWGLQADKLAINAINENNELPYIIDPSAGSGSFLIEYMKLVTNIVKHRCKNKINDSKNTHLFLQRNFYPDELENSWAERYIYGSEINPNLGTSVKVNMILHGDGSANIFVGSDKGDGLLYPKDVNESFDVIATNPPFSVELDNDTKKSVKNEFVFGDKKNSENLFIERYYQLLKENGRLGVVLPESIFDTTENKYIRLFIYKYFKVRAIVSLPQVAFEPFTSTKTSLLFAQKKTQNEIEKWNELWAKYSSEWNALKTRCENLSAIYVKGKDRAKLPSIKDLTEKEERKILEKMLKNHIEPNDSKLSAKQLIEKYQEELNELCKYDADTRDVFGFVNTWWVFGEVSKELNYKIFMAEAENVGYKRTKRGENSQANELYRLDDNMQVIIDDGKKETALDYVRGINWD